MAAIMLLTLLSGCRQVNVPRPRGHFRIALPEKEYVSFNGSTHADRKMPVMFEYPVYGKISYVNENPQETGWFNIEFPQYGASIYLTYKEVSNNFASLMEQTYRMNVKNHISKADAIEEKEFADRKNRVYGILYELSGNTATAVQFYATDSMKHYLRGSLYFSAEPDADSLAPVIDFFREDILHLVETLRWTE